MSNIIPIFRHTNNKKETMLTYRNANFTKRNYDCTNILFCQTANKLPDGKWYLCDEIEIEQRGCDKLYTQDGVTYFGYL